MESALKDRVEEKVLECLCKAEDVFRKTFPMIDISYNLRGTCAGQYCWNVYMGHSFKFNAVILAENADHFITQTVPHEVAHYIVRSIYGRSETPHGRVWKDVMSRIFGLDADRCHSYDVSNCKRKMTKHVWGCGCKDYKVTSQKHSKYIRHLNVIGVPVGYVIHGRMGCRICGSWDFTYKGVTRG